MFEAMTGNNDANKSARQRAYDPNKPRRAAPADDLRRRLVDIVKRKDTTRPVTLGAALPGALDRHTDLLELLDLVGYNYKEHLYEEDHGASRDKPIARQRERAQLRQLAGGRRQRLHRRAVPVDRHRLSRRGRTAGRSTARARGC